jgi:hypothetical protein
VSGQHEYVELFINSLPAELRPTDVNETIKKHLRVAWKNGWKADVLGKSVAMGNYANSSSPVGAAVYRLEKIASQKAPKENSIPRYVAPERREPLPPDWAKERIELLNAIANGLYESSEAAEEAMMKLLELQKAMIALEAHEASKN